MLAKIKNESNNPIYAKLNMEDISNHINDIAILENAINNKRVITATYNYIDYKKELLELLDNSINVKVQ